MPNGLEVLVIEDHSVPLATIEITVKNGSFTESPAYNGLSHLYEHMFFKANKDYPNEGAFLNKIKELGISFNGNTNTESVNYYFTLPSFNLTAGLKFMNAAIRFPKFDSLEMKKEDVVVNAEFQRNESSPYFALKDSINHRLFGNLYSRKNVIGNHEVILSATSAEMDSIKNKYYWPNNSLLTVAGDVNHRDVFDQVNQIMGSWKSSTFDPFKKYPIPAFAPLKKDNYLIVSSENARVPVCIFNWFGPNTGSDIKSTYAADLLSYILSQNSSKLSKALLDSGLALQANFSYLTQKYGGIISFSFVPNPSKIKQCILEAERQIDLLADSNYFTNGQLTTAKRQLEISDIRQKEVTSNYVHTTSFWWASASLNYYFTYLKNLQGVSRSDIQEYINKYIKNKYFVAGLLLSPEMEKKLNAAAFFNAKN